MPIKPPRAITFYESRISVDRAHDMTVIKSLMSALGMTGHIQKSLHDLSYLIRARIAPFFCEVLSELANLSREAFLDLEAWMAGHADKKYELRSGWDIRVHEDGQGCPCVTFLGPKIQLAFIESVVDIGREDPITVRIDSTSMKKEIVWQRAKFEVTNPRQKVKDTDTSLNQSYQAHLIE